MSKSHFGKIGCALICSASLGFNATAQDQSSQQTGRAGLQAGAGQQAGQLQGAGPQQAVGQSQNMIATCLVHDNQSEIALGRMAQEKAESGAVKKFAGMMVQDHQEFLTKLQRFAPNAGELSAQHGDGPARSGQNPAGQNQPGQNQVGQNPGGVLTPGQQNAGQMGDPSMLVLKMQQEVAQQCLSDAQTKLAKEDGEKFDKCYLGMQIAAHAGMKSKLTVFSRHAQGELKQLIDQGLQTTEKHLGEAESIMKDLAENSSESSGTARRSNDRSDSSNKSENR